MARNFGLSSKLCTVMGSKILWLFKAGIRDSFAIWVCWNCEEVKITLPGLCLYYG